MPAAVLLLLAVILAGSKVHLMRKSAREMTEALDERLETDTNTLISISSRDGSMRELARKLNGQLRQLREERHRHQQGDAELKDAVTNIAHDLRTPLTAIEGYLDLLEREEQSENAQRYLAQIRNRTSALGELTEELFYYGFATTTRDLKPESINLVRVLEESLLSFYASMQKKGIEPEISLPEGPVWRYLDPAAVNRVLSNIIGNSLKHSDGDLRVSMDSSGCITFSNTASKLDGVTVARLFDRFYTVETSRDSSGLGLAIAKTLTERMDGRIDASYSEKTLQIRVVFTD